MTVREIVAEWLVAHDYDGLAGEECGCTLDGLIPDCECAETCQPGRLQTSCEGCPCRDDGQDDCERSCLFRDDEPKRCVVAK